MYVIEVIVEPSMHPGFRVRDARDRLKDFFVSHQDRITSHMSDAFSCEVTAFGHGTNGVKLKLEISDYEVAAPSQEQLDELTQASLLTIRDDLPTHLGIEANSIHVLASGYAEIEDVA